MLPARSIARVSSSGTHTQPAAFNEAIITSAEWPCEMPRWTISVGLSPGCLLGSGGSGRDLSGFWRETPPCLEPLLICPGLSIMPCSPHRHRFLPLVGILLPKHLLGTTSKFV